MLARPSVAFAVGHTGASKVVIGKLDDVVIGNEGKVVNSKLEVTTCFLKAMLPYLNARF